MIIVRLLGGIKKSLGFSQMTIHDNFYTIDELVHFLEQKCNLKTKIKDDEVMVAINGIESSVLGGRQAKISQGDVVTFLSVVHGG